MSSRICQYVEQFSLCYCFPSLLFDLFSMSFQLFLYMFICFAEQTCSLYSVHMISIMLKTFSKIDQEFLHMIYHDFIYPNTFSAIIPSPKCRIPYYHFSTPQPYWFDIWKKKTKHKIADIPKSELLLFNMAKQTRWHSSQIIYIYIYIKYVLISPLDLRCLILFFGNNDVIVLEFPKKRKGFWVMLPHFPREKQLFFLFAPTLSAVPVASLVAAQHSWPSPLAAPCTGPQDLMTKAAQRWRRNERCRVYESWIKHG